MTGCPLTMTQSCLTTHACAPQSSHLAPAAPHCVRLGDVTHCPVSSQHPAHVVASQVTQPLACLGLPTRQKVPPSQGPLHVPPQPSDSPQALPAQSGVHAWHEPPPVGQKLPCCVQSTQVAPVAPHWVSVGDTHLPAALQQPLHVAELHGPEPPEPPLPPVPHDEPHIDCASDTHWESHAFWQQ